MSNVQQSNNDKKFAFHCVINITLYKVICVEIFIVHNIHCYMYMKCDKNESDVYFNKLKTILSLSLSPLSFFVFIFLSIFFISFLQCSDFVLLSLLFLCSCCCCILLFLSSCSFFVVESKQKQQYMYIEYQSHRSACFLFFLFYILYLFV